MELGRWWF
jgi:hypothetical protein